MNTAPPTDHDSQPFDEARVPVEAGRALIEASAGTGKTFALVALFIRLVLEGKKASRLLVVTFTNAATEELTRRIREGLRAARVVFEGAPCPRPALAGVLSGFEKRFAGSEEARRRSARRLRAALADSSDLAVFTIHGFCKHALEEWAFESGTAFRIDFAEGADDLLRRAAADCWHRRLGSTGQELLAEAAVALGWEVEDMLGHLASTERHPGTRVVPPAALDDVLGDLRAALDRLGEAWDAEAMQRRLAPFVWKKNAPLDADTLPRAVRRVAACAEGRLGPGLAAVRACATLREHANKNRTDRDVLADVCAGAGPQACAEVAAVVERLEHAFVRWFTAEVPARFRALKRRRRVMTFDDLLADLLRALEDPARAGRLAAAIRAAYDLALVDEFQDTDPRQYAIFKNIFGGTEQGGAGERPVFLIGDAKQAIYRFRGADLYTYLDARREAGRRFTLEKNWRSTTRLVEAVNAVFAQAPVPFLHAGIPFDPVEAAGQPDDAPLGDPAGKAPLVWWYHPPESKKNDRLKKAAKGRARPRIIEAVAGEIVRLLTSGTTLGDRPLRASDIAVLVRTNDQGEAMQAALQDAGVPAVVSATRSVLQTREMAEVETLLRAVLEPRPEHLRAALATELWGADARAIFDVKENAERWAALTRRFAGWKKDWQTHGVAYLLTRVLDEEGVRERLLAHHDGERRLTNVRHCVELLHEAEQRRQQAPSGLLRWIARRDDARLLENEETELRLETDERAVQVLTLHKSKGLEFEVVFCPFLWDTSFNKSQSPLVQTDEGVVYDLGSEKRAEHLALAQAEQLAEEIRLAYVGLTRAVHRCYVAWGDLRDAPASSLGYLLFAGAAEEEDFARTMTPVERAEAVRTVAQRAQAETDRPDRLRALFGEHTHMTVETLDEVERQSEGRALPPPAGGDGAAPAGARPLDLDGRLAPWRYASYSAWTDEIYDGNAWHGAPQHGAGAAEEERAPQGRFAFAAGVRAGRCLHEILEGVDFAAAPEKNARRVCRLLRRHRLDAPAHHRANADANFDPEAVVLDLLGDLREAALPGASFTFADVERRDRANEWGFSLPIARAAPRTLQPAFAQAPAGTPARDYAARLADLTDADLTDGFLRGTADLVFEKDGAYYLVDWKSNLLADHAAGYGEGALREAMLDHHYVLQYHLYAAALQRHLARRLPRYDHDRHFGGVWYIFLRGLQKGEPTGLFFDRPGAGLLDAINERLG